LKILPDKPPSFPEPDTPLDLSESKEMKKLPVTLPSEEKKQKNFLKKVLKLKNSNLKEEISPCPEISDSVSKNTLIWESNMIHTLVFSEWTSTLS
jgi:hypothetical protein